MLIVDYQSKSYHRFLNDMPQIADHKTRFLITFNGANENDLAAASADLVAYTENKIVNTTAIGDKASEETVTKLFHDARCSRNTLIFENADLLFNKKTAVKKSHERDNGFNLNNLFKSIAKHNGIVILATEKKQILSASMSTKMDVVVRFK
ncbi:hypothetical protein E2R68_06825 [Psychromonas sp. RZ22]|uniref:hypothetical protein n=1 Tax=Psychromonas algarum TaxID=2555643 RepID=UPI001067DBC7|nr:hypothetical protein [Psychromonas sp. RZ22]TEW54877.1 hypothetical protein E2R68_06825 [Psychromonas sp. RZ22]